MIYNINIYILYTPNLGFVITVPGWEREQSRFQGEHRGSKGAQRGNCERAWGSIKGASREHGGAREVSARGVVNRSLKWIFSISAWAILYTFLLPGLHRSLQNSFWKMILRQYQPHHSEFGWILQKTHPQELSKRQHRHESRVLIQSLIDFYSASLAACHSKTFAFKGGAFGCTWSGIGYGLRYVAKIKMESNILKLLFAAPPRLDIVVITSRI